MQRQRSERAPRSRAGLILLNLAGALIVLGGLYDIFTPSIGKADI